MNLNHLGLGVTEVPQTIAMFEKYFGLRRVDHFPLNEKMGFVNDDSGALITIFRVPDADYPKIFHIGFMQDTVEQVHAIHEQLESDGFAPEAMREEYGRKTFYFKAPGGFTVEVNAFITEATAARARSTAE